MILDYIFPYLLSMVSRIGVSKFPVLCPDLCIVEISIRVGGSVMPCKKASNHLIKCVFCDRMRAFVSIHVLKILVQKTNMKISKNRMVYSWFFSRFF